MKNFFSIIVPQIRRFFRYSRIYGLKRAFYKAAGRVRTGPILFFRPRRKYKTPDIGVIGNGQFAFSTLGFAIVKNFRNRFVDCFDISPSNQETFANFYSIKNPAKTIDDFFRNKSIEQIYIASNHGTHAEYAIRGLNSGKSVYVEKPLVTNYVQLKELISAKHNAPAGCHLFCGFNRPFSAAIAKLKSMRSDSSAPITLSMTVAGHSLDEEHWYRVSSEGSRICGNASHWIDLAIHLLTTQDIPDLLDITIGYSHRNLSDENISLTITSPKGDLVNLIFSCRNEPYEGVYETLFFQDEKFNCTIEDFRSMFVWVGDKLEKYRFAPKDAGHVGAIMQPFKLTNRRSWTELLASSVLTLEIADMTEKRETSRSVSLGSIISSIDQVTYQNPGNKKTI